MDLALRIAGILFPMFALTGLGYLYGRRHASDMSVANRLNMDIFVPALIFSGLSTRSVDLSSDGPLALGMVLLVLGSGAAGWLLAKVSGQKALTLAPPLMFNNSVNLGVPLAVLAFGPDVLPWAIILFVVSTGLHFSLGIWLLDHKTNVLNVWRNPAVLAALAGFTLSATHVALWPPLALGIKMLADISIPLALFALGVRMTDTGLSHWRAGLLGAIARPIAGMLIAWAVTPAARPRPQAKRTAAGVRRPAAGCHQLRLRRALPPGAGQGRRHRAGRQPGGDRHVAICVIDCAVTAAIRRSDNPPHSSPGR